MDLKFDYVKQTATCRCCGKAIFPRSDKKKRELVHKFNGHILCQECVGRMQFNYEMEASEL